MTGKWHLDIVSEPLSWPNNVDLNVTGMKNFVIESQGHVWTFGELPPEPKEKA